MSNVQLGLSSRNVLTCTLQLPRAYSTDINRFTLLGRIVEELQALPNIDSVGVASHLPFVNIGGLIATVDGSGETERETGSSHYFAVVNARFFHALGIQLQEGRLFVEGDTAGQAGVCVVDDVFAKRHWGEKSPLGARVYFAPKKPGDQGAQVVGIVSTTSEGDPVQRPRSGKVYYPLGTSDTPGFVFLTIRSADARDSIVSSVRAVVQRIEPTLPVSDIQPLDRIIDDSLRLRRTPVFVMAVFTAMALGLTLIGVYGVLAFDVVMRTRESAIRMALGASERRIILSFLGLALRLGLLGIGLGFGCALGIGRLIDGMLYAVPPASLPILTVTIAAIAAAVASAALFPAIRAGRTNVMAALRDE